MPPYNSETVFNPLYTGRLFHCYMLEESICHFRGVRSTLSLLFYFWRKILLSNTVDPIQKPHYFTSDLDLHICLFTAYRFSSKNGLIDAIIVFFMSSSYTIFEIH